VGSDLQDLFDSFPAGVYSGFRSQEDGRFVDLSSHLDRLTSSLLMLGNGPDYDRESALLALHQLMDGSCRYRLQVLPMEIEMPHGPCRVLIGIGPWKPLPSDWLIHGVHLHFIPHLSRPSPKVKSSSFAALRRPFPLYQREDYDRILTTPEGHILEGTSCNIIFIRGNTLVTAGEDVLEGITRKHVLNLADERNLLVRFDSPHISEIAQFQGAFVTSAARGIVPVVAISGHILGDGTPHPIAIELSNAYDAFARSAAQTPTSLI
jgi:branched-subunit amino acid aminotransferase/4-amino-4-deoxychorismate lyase